MPEPMSELPESVKTLQTRSVALWQASLDICPRQIRRFRQLLSREEAARAQRFLSETHRRRFVAAHGILRQILGRLTGICPKQLEFSDQGRGRPGLKNDLPFDFFCFNLSHSRDMMVLGVCLKGPVGVDVEWIKPAADISGLADRFFSSAEARAVRSRSRESAKVLFYQYWTFKEAYLKATGEGIARLGDIEIHHRSDGSYGLADRGCSMDGKWTILPVFPRPGYAGAVAVKFIGPDLAYINGMPVHDACL